MSDEPRIDPEVLALLHEVAEDPAARYFEGLRARGPVLTDRLQATSIAAVDLTKAEQQLVAVHREELAWILCMAAKRANAESPRAQDRFLRPQVFPQRDALEERTTRWMGRYDRPDDELTEAVALARSYLSKDSTTGMGERLARASLRVAPRDDARMQLGLALVLANELGTALATFHDILRFRPRDIWSSRIWVNVGLAESLQPHPRAALTAYRTACRMTEVAESATMSWLTWACLYGGRDEALEASEMVDAAPEAVAEKFAALLDGQRRRGEWQPTESSTRVAEFIAEVAGRPSRIVANAQI